METYKDQPNLSIHKTVEIVLRKGLEERGKTIEG
jgi:hypothetical protein